MLDFFRGFSLWLGVIYFRSPSSTLAQLSCTICFLRVIRGSSVSFIKDVDSWWATIPCQSQVHIFSLLSNSVNIFLAANDINSFKIGIPTSSTNARTLMKRARWLETRTCQWRSVKTARFTPWKCAMVCDIVTNVLMKSTKTASQCPALMVRMLRCLYC